MGLQGFINVMRERLRIVLVAAAILTLTAIVVSVLQSPTYQGEATVLLTQQNTGAALIGSPQPYLTDLALAREVQTQVDVMKSRSLLEQVIQTLHLKTTPTDLLKQVNIRFDGQTNIVTIDVTDGSAARASDTANALANAYVAWSLDRQRASIRAASDDVQKRLALAQKQIVDVQAAISAGDRSGAKQVELQASNSLYATLADQLEQLKINEQLATGSGSVLSSAVPNPAPVSPKPVRNGALGLALGLVLGIGMAFVAKTLDNTIKTSEEAEGIYGAPVLCNVPVERADTASMTLSERLLPASHVSREKRGHKSSANKSEDRGPARLTLIDNPSGPAAEAYRVLRNNLGFVNFEHDIKTVLVTSAVPSEGKSTLAANLATVLANAGKRVVLVGCDFHRPGSAQLFGFEHKVGLSEVLSGKRKLQDVLEQPKGFDSLWVLPAGSMPPNPSELLGSSAMEELVANIRESSDWVILDSAPLLAVADAAAAAAWVDGVLIVTHARVSTQDAARKARDQLSNVGARILGIALWGVEETAARGGYYTYYGASHTE